MSSARVTRFTPSARKPYLSDWLPIVSGQNSTKCNQTPDRKTQNTQDIIHDRRKTSRTNQTSESEAVSEITKADS